MPTIPRHRLVDSERPLSYHLVSRCVRREWLLGRDPRTGRDHSHRRRWVSERTLGLASLFAVALDGFAVMSNHFHLALHHDPKASGRWRAETVARRHTLAFPPRGPDGAVEEDRLTEVEASRLRRFARRRTAEEGRVRFPVSRHTPLLRSPSFRPSRPDAHRPRAGIAEAQRNVVLSAWEGTPRGENEKVCGGKGGYRYRSGDPTGGEGRAWEIAYGV